MKLRHLAIALVALFAAACAAPAFTPAPEPSPSPTEAVLRDLPGDAPPSRSPRPTPVATPSPVPMPSATRRPPIGADWPGRPIYTFPGTRTGGILGVTRGTIYTAQVTADQSDSSNMAFVVRGLTAAGDTAEGWPPAGLPMEGTPLGTVLEADGTLYLATVPRFDFQADDWSPSALSITAIGPNGRILEGWPYVGPATVHLVLATWLLDRPGDGICFTDGARGATLTKRVMEVRCLDAHGRTSAGWPYVHGTLFTASAIGHDGSIYLEEAAASGSPQYGTIIALSRNGRAKSEWEPITVSANEQILVGPDGNVFLVANVSESLSVVALDSHGRLREDWAENARAGLATISTLAGPTMASIGPDGTAFLVGYGAGPWAPGRPVEVHAFGPDGLPREGWPVSFDAVSVMIQLSPDGSIWVRWGDLFYEKTVNATLTVLDPDGAVRPGWPVDAPTFSPLGFDAAGTAYVVADEDGRAILEVVDPDGSP